MKIFFISSFLYSVNDSFCIQLVWAIASVNSKTLTILVNACHLDHTSRYDGFICVLLFYEKFGRHLVCQF